MRLQSMVFALSEVRQTLLRFPLALLSIVFAGVCAALIVENPEPGRLLPLLMSAQLGLPLLLALTLFSERSGAKWILQLAGMSLIIAYYFSLPDDVEGAPLIRFFQFNVGLHLLIAFVPYLRQGQNNGFWQFNRLLVQRLLSGALFSLTLHAGLCVAIFALDKLFAVPIEDDIYPKLFMLVAFIFNSWYFLGGVPRDLPALEKSMDYPKFLKIFAQHILATLVAIYMVILLAYLIKVVIIAAWPSGWIGILVSTVAVAGLAALVLLYPLVERNEIRWLPPYSRLFYILLLPAVGMLLLAIYKRVDQYGITENRYYLFVFALWLIYTSIRGLIDRQPNLKLLPLSLCVVALVTSFGPWGAFSVARESQSRRLSKLLVANEMLSGAQIVKPEGEVSGEDSQQIGEIIDYLIKQHGPGEISRWYPDRSMTTTEEIMDDLGLDYRANWNRVTARKFKIRRESDNQLFEIDAYDFAWPLSLSGEGDTTSDLGDLPYQLTFAPGKPGLTILDGSVERLLLPLDSVLVALERYANIHDRHDQAPGELLTVEKTENGIQVMLLIHELAWTGGGKLPDTLRSLDGILLISGDK
jgi:Domain of unknown function (DUF4153)